MAIDTDEDIIIVAKQQVQRYCLVCGKKTLHQREVFSTSLGFILTVITCGLFLILWLIIGFCEMFKPWRCQVCGKARWF